MYRLPWVICFRLVWIRRWRRERNNAKCKTENAKGKMTEKEHPPAFCLFYLMFYIYLPNRELPVLHVFPTYCTYFTTPKAPFCIVLHALHRIARIASYCT